MHPLNPFLRAFFKSAIPAQCSPIQHHVLLVPSTEALLNSRDLDTHALYADLASSEEFLASHVLRVPGGAAPSRGNGTKEAAASFRDTRGKAKQYSTVNGRTVIVKDSFVYSNKGFKHLNQIQLLNDVLYYPDNLDAQPWLVYFISKPLTGVLEAMTIVPASLENTAQSTALPDTDAPSSSTSQHPPKKKDIKTLMELMNHFPLIAKQMQPGLERIFREFGKEMDQPPPPMPKPPPPVLRRRQSSVSSMESLTASLHSNLSGTSQPHISLLELSDQEDFMRRSLETAVTAAIDLFQMVDKQQLSNLGATTDLTGPVVERLIERYVAEQVNDAVLFPRICAIRRGEDAELEARIRQMHDIDISQVGINLGNSRQNKQQLALRIQKAVDAFKRMGVASSPQEMAEILLLTQKAITMPESPPTESNEYPSASSNQLEKQDSVLTINADTLVSLLLIVVIRSSVRHLQARLSYMRHFLFIDDVESGEIGYALSTFEAVLSYLAGNSSGLRRSSRLNKCLWEAVRNGEVEDIKYLLQPELIGGALDGIEAEDDTNDRSGDIEDDAQSTGHPSLSGLTLHGSENDGYSRISFESEPQPHSGPLSHVFPFERPPTPPAETRRPPTQKKRVSMDTRSNSSSSMFSVRSQTTTMNSSGSGIDGDDSVEKLSKTQSPAGESVLMMAVDSGQSKSLRYLLSLTSYYPPSTVIEDAAYDGTTLLSAAIQNGTPEAIEVILDYLTERINSEEQLFEYFSRQDSKGRCIAHYLFNQPKLIPRIGQHFPWTLRDKNGQTPLFALCRSYDHEDYKWMCEAALQAATEVQGDGKPLRLDEHVDSKGNTLLHIINDPQLALKLLLQCDSDVNASNDKHFTPLMVASKYGRTDLVRTLFNDPRVDLHAKDLRGLTAVELAKDDEVRNKIDDLVLLATPPGQDGRITTVVRSFFVEDGTIRLILKSGLPTGNSSLTVTTCRRAMVDFENLVKWLAREHPASWLPDISNFTSPFLIPSKPSRAVLRDTQIRLDAFLRLLLNHTTFANHEMVWEFFLVPEMDPTLLEERSKRKAEARVEMIRDEYAPETDTGDVELFVAYAKESVRSVHHPTKSVLRRANRLRIAQSDLPNAATMSTSAFNTLAFLPQEHSLALTRFAATLPQSDSPPLSAFYYNLQAISSSMSAISSALARPSSLIAQIAVANKALDRHTNSMRRSDRWPNLGLLDEARQRMSREAAGRARASLKDMEDLGRELSYTRQVVAGELAGWQESRVRLGRRAIREFASKSLMAERARLEGMKRAVRKLGIDVDGERRNRTPAADGEMGDTGVLATE
ncbi:hypothetical protein P152DRAFT_454079 [Eremomyces bilateralis CBS 781.70]|uniref:VPS9 domain-containing protein n=1 Tax=Eremomyces bilateralis CBS 781.70 TaxID=1392243 RepID=A0A6G1GHN4_9PEZI|nr:uncharacterized protein P152DRAFT_454079 [Eremomyces bilateralis CBS 781.70]KAF1817492.1 hypothetical protein P152DRAFT_454079 [Eremomyces bilateralis CBS 781.70]